MTDRRKPLSRRGFSLIELLVVIGIIVVLAGIAVTSMGRVLDGQRRTRTKTILSNANSILAEYDAATSFKSQPAAMWGPGSPAGAKVTTGFNIWKDANPATTETEFLSAPQGNLEEAGHGDAVKWQAVLNTAVVLREAGRMPGAKKIMSQLPGDATMKVSEPAPGTAEIGPVLLDGWGNPIIFVPAAGLGPITLADEAQPYVIRSHRSYRANEAEITGGAAPPPAARPFFASAGSDGDFTKGDDNVYSFQN